MPRYKAVISYDGTNYSGFQRQNNALSIQEVLETTLTKMNSGKFVIVHPSGRTDAGVHAMGQVIHFDLDNPRDTEKIRFAFDTQIPHDINIVSVEEVEDTFHARFMSTAKEYHYHVHLTKIKNPFKRLYSTHYRFEVDVDAMRRAAAYAVGEHDFGVFCASGSSVDDKTRNVYEIEIREVNETELIFIFKGNGFLYKMVRMLVGTLLKVGTGKLPEDAIQRALVGQDKKYVGTTARPEGLFLMEVSYD